MKHVASLHPARAIRSTDTLALRGVIRNEGELARLTCLIEALKELQAELGTEANLADAAALLSALQRRYGASASLEQVIQSLVGYHLTYQLACRRGYRRRLEEVLL